MLFSTVNRKFIEVAVVCVVTIVCLIPFVGKAFHIDDPLFIWSAKQIQSNPADFYGFAVNWYSEEMSMAEVTKNPPMACYYIALVGLLFGWSEVVLHIAFLVPAVAAALGTYYLARQFCSRPVPAALAAVLTPVFLVSSTNIMCDTMMLAFWVWAVVLWMRGLESGKHLLLFLGAVLIAVCALTKYFGMILLVLLLVYSLVKKRKLGAWVLFLLIPVIILAGYQWLTYVLYGRGLLLDAVAYATNPRWVGRADLLTKGMTGLVFTGGCIITGLFYIPLLWSRKFITVGVLLTILFIFALSFAEKIGAVTVHNAGVVKWGFLVQLGLMAVAGVSLLGLAGMDLWKCRNAESLLLLLWVLGTFIFAGFINWTVNARSILPMVPAAGILLMRRIERRSRDKEKTKLWWIVWPLVPAALVAVLVGWADYTWANTARDAAAKIGEKFKDKPGNVWFQAHWGFQYYMEAAGGRALDFEHLELESDDVIIVPLNNTRTRLLSENMVHIGEVFRFAPCRWAATMNYLLGAGFYSDIWGRLPFAIGPVGLEEYHILIVK